MDTKKLTKLKIGFVGASHLAYCSAVATAEKAKGDWYVISYAENHDIDSIKEPLFDELRKKNSDNLLFSSSLEVIEKCDLVYIAIDVPTDDHGISDLSIIHESIQAIKGSLKSSAILIILSQVNPGFTVQIDFPKVRLFYQVETLIFGRAIDRALNPERYIIGSYNKEKALPRIYKSYLEKFKCPIFKMCYESAELAKISINLFLVSTITTTNLLANICEKIGAEWKDITSTLKLDKRIGPYAYLTPGLGLSGGNLERDISTIQKISMEKKLYSSYLRSISEYSTLRKNWVLEVFNSLPISEKRRLGVLGLSYKENTNSIKNSPSIKFLQSIPTNLYPFVFDPEVKKVEGLNSLYFCKTQQEVVDETNILAILTPWDCFKKLDLSNFKGYIIDPYGVTNNASTSAKKITLGKFNDYTHT